MLFLRERPSQFVGTSRPAPVDQRLGLISELASVEISMTYLKQWVRRHAAKKLTVPNLKTSEIEPFVSTSSDPASPSTSSNRSWSRSWSASSSSRSPRWTFWTSDLWESWARHLVKKLEMNYIRNEICRLRRRSEGYTELTNISWHR